jgi:hypothetical protein
MSNNIVQLISDQLGSGAVSKLTSLLGESPELTRSALGAAVPTLLAGMTQAGSTPEGAQRLSSIVGQQDPSIADNFAGSIPSSPSGYNPQAGSSLLTNLFGGSLTGGVTSTLSRFTGLKSGGMSNLLGMVAPLALGMLGKQQRSMGLDAGGLGNYLAGQKQNIMSAMPPGLANALSGIPGFSGFAQKPTTEPAVAHAGASPTLGGTSSGGARAVPERPAVPEVSPSRWLIPLVLLAALAWGLWSWSHHRRAEETTTPQATQPTLTTGTGAASQFIQDMRSTLNDGAGTLSGITDVASADKALPQLDQFNDKLAGLKSQMDKLPDSAKATASSAIQPWISKIRDLSTKAGNIPGAGDKLKPTLDKLNATLGSFAPTQ